MTMIRWYVGRSVYRMYAPPLVLFKKVPKAFSIHFDTHFTSKGNKILLMQTSISTWCFDSVNPSLHKYPVLINYSCSYEENVPFTSTIFVKPFKICVFLS